jgi:branched-chain amino acid aminotransferase
MLAKSLRLFSAKTAPKQTFHAKDLTITKAQFRKLKPSVAAPENFAFGK